MRRVRNRSFVTEFAAVSAVLLAALGLVLGQLMATLIEDRAAESTAEYGETVTRLWLAPVLTQEDLQGPLDESTAAELDDALRQLAGGSSDLRPMRLKIFSAEGVMVHSDDPALIGRSYDSPDLLEALDGEVVSGYTELSSGDELGEDAFTEAMEVYVPLDFGTGRIAGVAEIYLPWAPVAADIRRDQLTVYLALGAGLVVFHLAMHRLVRRTSRRLTETADRNAYLAHHDTLTGLANRSLLLERLDTSLVAARRTDGHVGILLVDLDRFKEINDTLGHDTGDELLCAVAERLVEGVDADATVARLGGDEFVLLLPGVGRACDAEAAATRLLRALHRPFLVRGVEFAVEASVGVAVFPEHGEDQGALLQHADIAMYAAKAHRGTHAVYDPQTDDTSLSRLTLLHDLRRALDDDQLTLHYQPTQDLADGRISGVEALLRWEHPERGTVLPGDFIPLAEQTGLMGALTDRVLELALQQSRAWQDAGDHLRIAVNLSARNLSDIELPARVRALAERYGADLSLLEVEVTETSAMADPASASAVLGGLADLGISVSVDDFGTGYSSLAYLRGLPIDALKIDRSFVSQMLWNDNDAVIVRSTIDLARNLGLRVVAEGVEDEPTRLALGRLGCHVVQGYVLSPPAPADETARFVRSHQHALLTGSHGGTPSDGVEEPAAS